MQAPILFTRAWNFLLIVKNKETAVDDRLVTAVCTHYIPSKLFRVETAITMMMAATTNHMLRKVDMCAMWSHVVLCAMWSHSATNHWI